MPRGKIRFDVAWFTIDKIKVADKSTRKLMPKGSIEDTSDGLGYSAFGGLFVGALLGSLALCLLNHCAQGVK